MVTTLEFDVDWSPPQVGSHGEVSNGCNHGNTTSDVIEETMAAWLRDSKTKKCDGCDGHDRANRPVPVRTAYGDINVGLLPIHN